MALKSQFTVMNCTEQGGRVGRDCWPDTDEKNRLWCGVISATETHNIDGEPVAAGLAEDREDLFRQAVVSMPHVVNLMIADLRHVTGIHARAAGGGKESWSTWQPGVCHFSFAFGNMGKSSISHDKVPT